MKTLLKTYYHQPQVNTEQIMQNLVRIQEKNASLDMILFPSLVSAGFLMVFVWFIINLNIDFLSVGLGIYFAVGGFLFWILNIMTGLLLFIVQNYSILLLVTSLVFLIQVLIPSLKQQLRTHLR